MSTKKTIQLQFDIPEVNLEKILSKINITHLLLVTTMLRLFVMPFPGDGGLVFDEAHYTKAVDSILLGKHANPEHPPLTKVIVAISIKIFGNYWFAWRFPMVVCSIASTYLVYLIAKEFFDEQASLFATAFIMFDIIWFIHGNIFMLEPPSIAFGLLFTYLYLKKRYVLSAIPFSIACLANEKTLFFMFNVVIYHIWTTLNSDEPGTILKKITQADLMKFSRFCLIFLLLGVGGLGLFDLIMPPSKGGHESVLINHVEYQDQDGNPVRTETVTTTKVSDILIRNPISHAFWMLEYYTTINKDFDPGTQDFRPPWNWVTPVGNSISVFNHAKYFVTSVSAGDKSYKPINYRAQTPIFIWYMTLPILAMAIYTRTNEAKFLGSWILGSFFPWLIKDIIQQNMTFNHYFQYTIPAICLGIPWFWKQVSEEHWKKIAAIHLLLTAVFFIWFFPVGLIRKI
jgi:hypothetical protein